MTDPDRRRGEPAERPEEPIRIEAADARAGDIVLRKRWQRRVFIAGLVGITLLILVVRIVGW
jgi:hypothetical protein